MPRTSPLDDAKSPEITNAERVKRRGRTLSVAKELELSVNQKTQSEPMQTFPVKGITSHEEQTSMRGIVSHELFSFRLPERFR